jgi:hypothetical protein
MDLSLIKTLLPVLILLISGLIVAVRIQSHVKELQKDLDTLQKRETYVVVVKLQAQMEQAEKNISSLWTYTNSLRNKLNGH